MVVSTYNLPVPSAWRAARTSLNAHFGNWRMADIQQADVVAFCKATYPRCGPHGLDRQVFTPLIAIWRRAAKANLCEMRLFERPEKPDRKPINPPDDAVIAKLIPHCSLRLAAAVLLMTFTGARVSEACRLTERSIDWARGEATLLRTKKRQDARGSTRWRSARCDEEARGDGGAVLRVLGTALAQPSPHAASAPGSIA